MTTELDGHDIVLDVKCTLAQNDSKSEVEDIPTPSAREAVAALDVLRCFGGRLGALQCVYKLGQAVMEHIEKAGRFFQINC